MPEYWTLSCDRTINRPSFTFRFSWTVHPRKGLTLDGSRL
jgi:hypothetical protein